MYSNGIHPTTSTRPFFTLDPDVTELILLLPVEQARRLEQEANQRGLTVAALLRCLIQALLEETT